MHLSILEKIGGLYNSKAGGHDIREPKKRILNEIESHINKLNNDIAVNKRLMESDKLHRGSLAENEYLLEEYRRLLEQVKYI